MTISEAVREFTEWRGYNKSFRTINGNLRDLTHFCIYLQNPDMDVETIRLEDLMHFITLLEKLGYDQNTLQKKAVSAKLFFDYLNHRGHKVLDGDLIPIPSKIFRMPRVADEESYKKLLAVIPEHGKMRPAYYLLRDKAIIMLVHDTGARNSEITGLDIPDLNLEKMAAGIKTKKSRGFIPFREIFWTAETNEVLKKWLAARVELAKSFELIDREAVFIGVKARGVKGRRMAVSYVSEIFRKYSNKAGLEFPNSATNPHAYRHKFGRDLAMNRENDYAIASLLGHARVQSSYPYTMLFGQQREDVYRRMRESQRVDNGRG